jgi:tripartite-type tricarboxylate transporter receptor subunit TctC
MGRCSHAMLLGIFAAAFALSAGAQQANYPTRSIRLIVAFAPGGSTDTVARAIGRQLGERLGQSVVIDNRTGAGGSVGTEMAARAAADGYTLTMGTTSTHPISAAVYSKLRYDPVRDFEPIALVAISHFLLVVHPDVRSNTLQEFISLVRAQPGKLNYASAGLGSSTHFAMALLIAEAKLDMVHVPFGGSAPATTAIVGGQVQALFSAAPALIPQVKAGRVRALAIGSTARAAVLPDVPTVAESGFPGFEAGLWFGFFAPKGTPAPVVRRLHAELINVAQSPEVKEQFDRQGLEPRSLGPAELGKLVKTEVEKFRKVIKTAGIKLD